MPTEPTKPFQAWDPTIARSLLEAFPPDQSAMLPMLHRLQDAFGYVHADAKQLLAEKLNLSLAEVHGVITFYHDFRTAPPPRLVVKVCRAEACQATGAVKIAQAALDHFQLSWREPTADGSLAIEPTYCLGLCAAAPAALVGQALTAEFDAPSLVARIEAAL